MAPARQGIGPPPRAKRRRKLSRNIRWSRTAPAEPVFVDGDDRPRGAGADGDDEGQSRDRERYTGLGGGLHDVCLPSKSAGLFACPRRYGRTAGRSFALATDAVSSSRQSLSGTSPRIADQPFAGRRTDGFIPANRGYLHADEGELRFGCRSGVSTSENGALDVRHDAAGNEVTVGVAWLWCIACSLAGWTLVAWALERVV